MMITSGSVSAANPASREAGEHADDPHIQSGETTFAQRSLDRALACEALHEERKIKRRVTPRGPPHPLRQIRDDPADPEADGERRRTGPPPGKGTCARSRASSVASRMRSPSPAKP